MAYIKVNHNKFESAAQAIDRYIADTKKKMTNAANEVKSLSANWKGNDYTQFRSQWSKVTSPDSTYSQMIKSYESYARFLRYAADKYKNAQANAINRANSLPRW